MNRSEKSSVIDQLHRAFAENPHVILANFRGLTVNQANVLRRRVRDAGGHYRVIKNRLAKRAAAGTAAEKLGARFSGPCAIVAHENDPIVLAKVLNEFAKDNPQIEFVGGLVDSRDVIDAAGVRTLATLSALPELRAQLLALIQTPATMLVRLLSTPGTQVARVLDARRQKLEGDADG